MSNCHGPSCNREALVEFFCSENCQSRWNGQLEPPPLPDEWLQRMQSAAYAALARLVAQADRMGLVVDGLTETYPTLEANRRELDRSNAIEPGED